MQADVLVIVLKTLGWVAFILACALLGYALFRDRSGGRRRCPKCWYDMSSTSGRRCSECGHEASSERALHRTRRRWRRAVMALALMPIAYAVWSAPRVWRSGWIGFAPTSALIVWAGSYEPMESYRNGAMSLPTRWAQELSERFARQELWRWQFRWLLDEVGAVYAQEKWPKGQPYLVSTGVPRWLQTVPFQFTSDIPGPRGEPPFMPNHMFAWNAGELPAQPVTEVGIAVTADKYTTTYRFRVEQVETPEDAITAVSGAEIDAAVRRACARLGMSYDKNDSTNTDYLLGVRLDHEAGPLPNDLIVAMRVDFLYEGVERATFRLCPLESVYGAPVDWIRIKSPEPGWDTNDPNSMDRWVVRVRGDALTALRDVKRKRYWSGEYTVPLREFIAK